MPLDWLQVSADIDPLDVEAVRVRHFELMQGSSQLCKTSNGMEQEEPCLSQLKSVISGPHGGLPTGPPCQCDRDSLT